MSRWLGTWELIPEICYASKGEPPEAGRYRIQQEGGMLAISVSWTRAGKTQKIAFAAPPDGRRVPSRTDGVDAYAVTAREDGTLFSEAYTGKVAIARSRRRVSQDGTLMSILTETSDGRGGWTTAFQVYRKTEG